MNDCAMLHSLFCLCDAMRCDAMHEWRVFSSLQNVSYCYFNNFPFPSTLGGKKMRGDKSNLKWVSKYITKRQCVCVCV